MDTVFFIDKSDAYCRLCRVLCGVSGQLAGHDIMWFPKLEE
jgi:hypothetical protein